MTEITKEQLDELKETMMNASPGRWFVPENSSLLDYEVLTEDGEHVLDIANIYERDLEWIETANPETISALIHFIEKQHEVLKATLDAVNEGHISAGEDYILKLSNLVRRLEP